MRKTLSYILFFSGFVWSLSFLLNEMWVDTDKGETIYRSLEYATIVIAIAIFIYLVFRDAAIVVRGKKFTEE